MKHSFLMNILHFLFGHQNVIGNWLKKDFNDGASMHAICRYCGKKGMIDSQGNLF